MLPVVDVMEISLSDDLPVYGLVKTKASNVCGGKAGKLCRVLAR